MINTNVRTKIAERKILLLQLQTVRSAIIAFEDLFAIVKNTFDKTKFLYLFFYFWTINYILVQIFRILFPLPANRLSVFGCLSILQSFFAGHHVVGT